MTFLNPEYPLVHVEEIISILNKIAIFGGLNKRQLRGIFRLLKQSDYKADEYVYKKGDPPSHIYIIKSGEVRIMADIKASFELIAYKQGQCFGETAVIGIQPQAFTAVAVVDTQLLILERKDLLNIFETDKELFGMLIMNIARETCRELSMMDKMLLDFVTSEMSKK